MRLRLTFRSKKSAAQEKNATPQLAPAAAEPEQIAAVQEPAPAAISQGAPRIKTYVAGSVGQAMATARRELGEEAILIYSKRIEDSTDPKRQYEITFGVIHEAPTLITDTPVRVPVQSRTAAPSMQPESTGVTDAVAQLKAAVEEAAPVLQPAAEMNPAVEEVAVLVAQAAAIVEEAAPIASAPEAASNNPGMVQEFALMRQEIYALRTMLARSAWGSGSATNGTESSSRTYALLKQQGLDQTFATEAALAVDENASGESGDEIGEADIAALTGFLASRVRTDCSLGWDQSAGKATVLIGPPGCGKTTSLVKLALEYGVKRGRRVEIYSLDRQKTEPNRTLEAMAVMLNIPYRPLGSIEALAVALQSRGDDNTLVLVDTSGFGTDSIDRDRGLSDLLQSGAAADVHLVLPAAWHPASIRRAVDRFEIFQPSRLLFTMLDQAGVTGTILQEAWRTGKPLSFFNDGALGGGNIQPATLENVLRGMELTAVVEAKVEAN